MDHRNKLGLLPPNRGGRTYPGGATLDRLAGVAAPQDSHFAEDWIGSVTRSTIPGREQFYEGVSQVVVGGETFDFRRLIESDPEARAQLGADFEENSQQTRDRWDLYKDVALGYDGEAEIQAIVEPAREAWIAAGDEFLSLAVTGEASDREAALAAGR